MPETMKILAMLAGPKSVGENIFATATAALVDNFGCRLAGIACLSDGGEFIRILTPAGDGVIEDLLRLDLKHAPARALYDKSDSSPMHIIGDFGDKFPTYQKRIEFPVHRYTAVLFHWPDGRPAGHVFMLDDRDVERTSEDWGVFDLLCRRIEAEYVQRSGFSVGIWLDTLVDGAGAGLVLSDVDGRIVAANDMIAQWLGLRSGSDFIGDRIEQWLEPNVVQLCRRATAELLEHGAVDEFEIPFIARDGTRHDFAVILTMEKTPAGIRFLSLLRDVRKRKEAERSRRRTEEKFQYLVENSLEAVIIADEDRQPLFVNPTAAHMFGYGGTEELSAQLEKSPLVARHELPRLGEWRRKIFAGEDAEI